MLRPVSAEGSFSSQLIDCSGSPLVACWSSLKQTLIQATFLISWAQGLVIASIEDNRRFRRVPTSSADQSQWWSKGCRLTAPEQLRTSSHLNRSVCVTTTTVRVGLSARTPDSDQADRQEDYVQTRNGRPPPRKHLGHRDSIESFEGVMIPRRNHTRELHYPRKDLDFDDGGYRRKPSRSRSSRSSRKRHHSRYDDSDTDSDSALSSDEEQKKLQTRKKTLLAACLATVTTVAAGNNIYQSTKAHQIRNKQMQDGKLSDYEMEELKRKGRKMDFISLGIGAVCLYNVRNGWKKMEMQQKEAREAHEQHEKGRNLRD